MIRRIAVACLLVLVAAPPASAQRAYRLTLEKPELLKTGQIVVVAGVSDPKGHRTFLEGLSVLQPVDVALVTLGKDDDVELGLAKDHFDQPLRRGSTRGTGVVSHKLRTEGEMRFIVKANGEPRPYRLVIWVGDQVQLPMPSALVPRSTSNGLPWGSIAAGLLALALLGGAFVFFRGRGKTAAVVAAVLIGSSSIAAQSGPMRGDPSPFLGGPRDAQGWADRAQELTDLFGWDTGSTALDWWKEHEGFTPEDDRYVPDLDPDGSPDLPVACGLDESSSCSQCYMDAQGRLNGARLQLERLRALYESTKRYVDKSIAFGDNVSGIHGASGLAWHAERRGIMAEFEKFERTHESKRQDLMKALRAALDAVAACEAEHFNNPDWYNRFGFMYYQFMDARYRR